MYDDGEGNTNFVFLNKNIFLDALLKLKNIKSLKCRQHAGVLIQILFLSKVKTMYCKADLML